MNVLCYTAKKNLVADLKIRIFSWVCKKAMLSQGPLKVYKGGEGGGERDAM